MSNRQYDAWKLGVVKRRVELYALIAVPSGTTPVLQKYNYPQLGQVGGSARTLSAAATASAAPLGYPSIYQAGADGVYSVARTGTGLWTLTLQDKYQRLLSVSGSMDLTGGAANIIAVANNPDITDLPNTSGKGSIVGIILFSATATPADPTAGATSLMRIKLEFGDATEP